MSPTTTRPGGQTSSRPQSTPTTTTAAASMAPINDSRPLPCREDGGMKVGLGVIAPCLFVSVCLNCILYIRLKKTETAVLFERFRRSMRRGESDRLIESDDDADATPRRSSYQRDGIRSARTQSLVRPRSGNGHSNPIFDSYAESTLWVLFFSDSINDFAQFSVFSVPWFELLDLFHVINLLNRFNPHFCYFPTEFICWFYVFMFLSDLHDHWEIYIYS